jgi:hypothetical protein
VREKRRALVELRKRADDAVTDERGFVGRTRDVFSNADQPEVANLVR